MTSKDAFLLYGSTVSINVVTYSTYNKTDFVNLLSKVYWVRILVFCLSLAPSGLKLPLSLPISVGNSYQLKYTGSKRR